MPAQLTADVFLTTLDPLPAEHARRPLSSAATAVVLHKSTYPANAPSEDRSTLSAGEGFIFGGVWDGHGGTACSTYAETKIWELFAAEYNATQDVEKAFTAAYSECDSAFLAQSLAANDAAALFSGTCAVGCFVDCASNTITCANIGDSRAVVGRFDSEVGSLNQFSVSCIIEMKWLFATSRFKMIE
jgi:serine/threonine protein phosphatase PrpC